MPQKLLERISEIGEIFYVFLQGGIWKAVLEKDVFSYNLSSLQYFVFIFGEQVV
jgi:hypothetical protein